MKIIKIEKQYQTRVPLNYLDAVKNISLIFKFQRVYDPISKKLTTLREIPYKIEENLNNLIGPEFENYELFINGKLNIKKLTKREIYYETKKFDNQIPEVFECKKFDSPQKYPNKSFEKFPNKAFENFPNKAFEKFPNKIIDNIKEYDIDNFDDNLKKKKNIMDFDENFEENFEEFIENSHNLKGNILLEKEINYLFEICEEISLKKPINVEKKKEISIEIKNEDENLPFNPFKKEEEKNFSDCFKNVIKDKNEEIKSNEKPVFELSFKRKRIDFEENYKENFQTISNTKKLILTPQKKTPVKNTKILEFFKKK